MFIYVNKHDLAGKIVLGILALTLGVTSLLTGGRVAYADDQAPSTAPLGGLSLIHI